MYIDKYSRNRLYSKYVSTLIVMPSVNLMFPKQYFGHQDPQFSIWLQNSWLTRFKVMGPRVTGSECIKKVHFERIGNMF